MSVPAGPVFASHHQQLQMAEERPLKRTRSSGSPAAAMVSPEKASTSESGVPAPAAKVPKMIGKGYGGGGGKAGGSNGHASAAQTLQGLGNRTAVTGTVTPGPSAAAPMEKPQPQQRQATPQTQPPQPSSSSSQNRPPVQIQPPIHRQHQPQPHGQTTHVPHVHPPLTLQTLEKSYFNVEPHDEFTREVGDWIWGFIANRDYVEIEAKIGILLDSRRGLPPNTRVSFPLATETIIVDASFSRFQSNMTPASRASVRYTVPNRVPSQFQHRCFNDLLNARAKEASLPGYEGAPIRYMHTKERDSFYPGDGVTQDIDQKIRATFDDTTGQIKPGDKAIIQKTRIADMNVFSPKRAFDFRISVSVEIPVPMPTSSATHSRRKNRVSYQHQACTIDLTQVQATNSKEILHELEIEFSDIPLLIREGYKAKNRQESIYYELVQVFLNNIRMLVRNAAPPNPA